MELNDRKSDYLLTFLFYCLPSSELLKGTLLLSKKKSQVLLVPCILVLPIVGIYL